MHPPFSDRHRFSGGEKIQIPFGSQCCECMCVVWLGALCILKYSNMADAANVASAKKSSFSKIGRLRLVRTVQKASLSRVPSKERAGKCQVGQLRAESTLLPTGSTRERQRRFNGCGFFLVRHKAKSVIDV